MVTRLAASAAETVMACRWADAIESYVDRLRMSGLSQKTVELRCFQLRRLAVDFPEGPQYVSSAQLMKWLGHPSWSVETRRSHLAAVRGFFRWMMLTGLVETDCSACLPSVKPRQHVPHPFPTQWFSQTLAGATQREELMLLLAFGQGLRRGEISRVAVEDLEEDLTGWSLLVHGKGGRLRRLPLWPQVAAMILDAGA